MDYIWNENYPIAIHITEGEHTPEQLQTIANHEHLVVRDLRLPSGNTRSTACAPSYYPTETL